MFYNKFQSVTCLATSVLGRIYVVRSIVCSAKNWEYDAVSAHVKEAHRIVSAYALPPNPVVSEIHR